MGQQIICSYKIPEAFSGEHLTEMDGKTQDDKYHTLPLTIEIETNLPVFEKRTIMSADNYISGYKHNLYTNNTLIENIEDSDEIS